MRPGKKENSLIAKRIVKDMVHLMRINETAIRSDAP
jgi:hypothetical protein